MHIARSLLPLLFAGMAMPLLAQVPAPTAIGTVEDVNRRGQQFRQSGTALQEAEQNVPMINSSEMEDVGPQFIVKSKPRRHWIEATADAQYYYSDNMFLQESSQLGITDTTILVLTGQFALAPTAFDVGGGKLSPRLGFRQQTYFYSLQNDDLVNSLNNFDFDAQTAFADLSYLFYETWQARMGADWTRLITHEKVGNEFYEEALPRWGLDKFFPFGDKMIFSVSYDGNYHLTSVTPQPMSDINDRTDQSLTLAWTQQVVRRFIARPYYRFQHTTYINKNLNADDRTDYLNTVGLILSYQFNDWASVRLFCSYDMKDSDDRTIADYDKFDGGGGATLTFRY
ncbi:MAG: hypothetical protein SFY92_01095 [Verrucomicrobiae bacterium]|nr:hypothetical protein [Verrucomicrobiae bacterium]